MKELQINLNDAVKSVSGCLTRFGGHKAAAGLSIDPRRLQEFTDAFERVAAERLDDAALIPSALA